MERKLLYTVGNLYTGYPYAVEAELDFGSVEIHGPFESENAADRYADELVLADRRYVSVKVIRIETPQVGRTRVRDEHGYVLS
jgi:hypothetical protein